MELLILYVVSHWSKSQEFGDGPSPKRDPSPTNVSYYVFSISQVGVEFLHHCSSPKLHMFAHIFPSSSSDFLLEGQQELLETFLFHKLLLHQMFIESFCSLVGVEGSGISCFDFNLLLTFFPHFLRSSFLVLLLDSLSLKTSSTKFPTTSSRVRELGFDISWLFLGGKELGFRDFEGFGFEFSIFR